MKSFLFLTTCSICLLVSSCSLIPETPEPSPEVNCEFVTDLSAPDGLSIETLGLVDVDKNIDYFQDLQIINDQLAFAMGGTQVGGYIGLMTSTNQGQSWERIDIGHEVHPRSLAFRDKSFGLITGMQNSILNTLALRTEDGGQHWEKLEYPDLDGILYHPQYDHQGNIYAYLGNGDDFSLMRSQDNGTSWRTLFRSPDLGFQQVTFSFVLAEGIIYASGRDGKLLKIDTDGSLLATFETGVRFFTDLKVIDEDHLIVFGPDQILRSDDGGLSWEQIYDKASRLIDFPRPEEGLVILNNSFCPSDVGPSNDVFARTVDAGQTWISGEEASSLRVLSSNAQQLSEGVYWLILDNQLLRIALD